MICSKFYRVRHQCCATKKKFSSFEDMLTNSDTPLLVDFYATWCGPCVMMANVLEVRRTGVTLHMACLLRNVCYAILTCSRQVLSGWASCVSTPISGSRRWLRN